MTQLATVVASAGADTVINQNNRALSPAALYGVRQSGTAGLVLGYFGGAFNGVDVADGTVTLTPSATNYVVAHRATGVVSAATSTTNWLDTTTYLQLYQLVAGSSTFTIAATSDRRQAYGGTTGGGGGGMSNPMTNAGDIIYGGTPSGGVAPPTRLAAGTNGYVLTLSSGLPTWAAAPGGFSNPMTTAGDLILGGAAGAAGRLGIGGNGQVLTVTAGVVGWAASASGFANPMTTVGDLIVGGASGAAGRLAAGAATYVLTSNGAGVAPTWQAPPGGGGLTGFTSSLNSASPNATINTSAVTASGGTTNQDAALVPKGTGALIAAIPDGASAGGNKRGANAVDLQTLRTNALHVASSLGSAIGGGVENRATQNYAVVSGGRANTANSPESVVSGGFNNSATSPSGGSTVTGGRDNVCSGFEARVGGSGGSDRGIARSDIFGDGGLSYQRGTYCLLRYTTSATPAVATAIYNSVADAQNTLTLGNNTAIMFSALVIARQSGSSDAKCWKFEGAVVRGASAGTTALVAAVTPTVVAAAAGTSAWAISVGVDTTLGGLSVTVTGEAGKNINWHITLMTSEVGSV